MSRPVLAIGVLLGLAGCTTLHPLPRPADGYDAIRFKQTIVLTDHSINEYQFLAGIVLTSDRMIDGERQISAA